MCQLWGRHGVDQEGRVGEGLESTSIWEYKPISKISSAEIT